MDQLHVLPDKEHIVVEAILYNVRLFKHLMSLLPDRKKILADE